MNRTDNDSQAPVVVLPLHHRKSDMLADWPSFLSADRWYVSTWRRSGELALAVPVEYRQRGHSKLKLLS